MTDNESPVTSESQSEILFLRDKLKSYLDDIERLQTRIKVLEYEKHQVLIQNQTLKSLVPKPRIVTT